MLPHAQNSSRPALARVRWTPLVVAATTATVFLATALHIGCPFRTMLGLDCPMCGGTRMVRALLCADLPAAFGFNAFALLVFLPLVLAVVVASVRMELGRAQRMWPSGRLGIACAVAAGGACIAWTVLRNLPFWPFVELRS